MPVFTENLNPNVLTMKSAQYGARFYDAGSLILARDRRILAQWPTQLSIFSRRLQRRKFLQQYRSLLWRWETGDQSPPILHWSD